MSTLHSLALGFVKKNFNIKQKIKDICTIIICKREFTEKDFKLCICIINNFSYELTKDEFAIINYKLIGDIVKICKAVIYDKIVDEIEQRVDNLKYRIASNEEHFYVFCKFLVDTPYVNVMKRKFDLYNTYNSTGEWAIIAKQESIIKRLKLRGVYKRSDFNDYNEIVKQAYLENYYNDLETRIFASIEADTFAYDISRRLRGGSYNGVVKKYRSLISNKHLMSTITIFMLLSNEILEHGISI